VRHAAAAGHYGNLITSGVSLDRQRLAARGHPHLAQVVRRHLESVGRKALLHRLQGRLVRRAVHSQQVRNDVDRTVVLGRTQTSGRDDDVVPWSQANQRRTDGGGIVRDMHEPA
jgi:hypothetical protein